jgi:cytochrome P450
LLQEAEQFIIAGTETTGYALSTTTFYILQDADIQERLRQELMDAGIVLDDDLDIMALQNLPYLVSILFYATRYENYGQLTFYRNCNLVCCYH